MEPAVFLPLLAAAILVAASASNVVLSPIAADKPCAAFVLIQGAQIPAERYVPLMQAIQQATPNLSLWMGSPDFQLNTPEPLVIGSGVSDILASMKSKGLNSTSCTLFIGGHSLGGALVQDWTAQETGLEFGGQVLLGSFLLRKWRNASAADGWHYPVSTLTVGGELDGLSRITRMAEGFWHQVAHPDSGLDPGDFPLVVLPGVSHFQFASGKPPFLVRERDFHPEVTLENAHTAIAETVAAYLMSRSAAAAATTGDRDLRARVEATAELLRPLIEALTMEGFYHFLPPCNSGPVTPHCAAGSPWSEIAQSMMGGLEATGLEVNATDRFHPVYQINPVHLPHILNNCTAPASCRLSIATVTQNIYAVEDSLDTAFFPVAATTMRVKLKSRQAVRQAAGARPAEFNVTDAPSICRAVNEASLAWAREHAAASTLQRFDRIGEPLVFGDDLGPYNAGPLWIWNDMHYTEQEPGPSLLVQSPMMKTPTDYWEPAARGFHYCKLLSPGRAMEWLYVDGLRAHDSLANETLTAVLPPPPAMTTSSALDGGRL